MTTITDAVRRGRGAVLTGEAGVGKTRLARAVLEQLEVEGWTTAVFESGPEGGAVPFLPFASLTRSSGSGELDRVIDAAQALVARGERVAALVDDAHALDTVSLALVTHLLAATDVRLLLTVRSGDAGQRLVRAWSTTLERVEVAPLDRATVEQLVRTALGETEPVAQRWVWDTTAGNPLFVRELVTDAVERGALAERDGRWTFVTDGPPPGRRLRDVVSDRFGALSDGERDAVELLAIGAPIGLRILERLAGADAVQALERRGLVTADRSGHRIAVRLAHPIHGEVVRKALGPSTSSAHLRRLLDEVIVTGGRRRSDRLPIALWRAELGDTSDPAGLLAAAEDLVVLGDSVARGGPLLDRAVQLARAALESGGDLDAAVFLLWLLNRLGRTEEARAVHDALGDLLDDEAAQVLVVRRLADIDALLLGDPHAAIRRLTELEAILTSPGLRRTLRASRAEALTTAGDLRAAHDLAREILDDADATPAERVRASVVAATALASGAQTAEALRLLDAAGSLASNDDIRTSVSLILPRIVALGGAGMLDDLERLLTWWHSLSDQLGLDDGIAMFGSGLANTMLLRGRPRAARAWADTALAHIGDTDLVGVRRLALAVSAHARALNGDAPGASTAIASLDALGGAGTFQHDETRARAWTHVARGRTDRAIEDLVRAGDTSADRGHVVGAVSHLHDVARLGRADLVVARITSLGADADGALVPAQVAHVLALHDDDADALEHVGAAFVEIGITIEAAEAFAAAAAVHRRAGRRGRAGNAAARSRELVASCEDARTPAMVGAEPLLALTRREREIVQLAADGLSDRSIADRLVVSIRTVQAHLHHSYAKLGVEGREELTATIADG